MGAERHRAGEHRAQQGNLLGQGQVRLVQGDQLGDVRGPLNRIDDRAHGLHLGDRVGVRGVHDVQDHIRLADLLQGRAEGLDQLGGQVAHEADRVGERVLAPVSGASPAHGRVEGREERVLDEDARVRQTVQQRRLAGVRVPGDGHRWYCPATTRSPLCASGGFHACNVRAQLRHTRADTAAIQLDLRLTGTPGTDTRAARDAATGLTGHGLAPAAQTRQQVLKLGQLHLRLALTRLGVLSKNIEDEGGAINDLSVDNIFQPAALGGSQLLVDDDGVGLDAAHDVS